MPRTKRYIISRYVVAVLVVAVVSTTTWHILNEQEASNSGNRRTAVVDSSQPTTGQFASPTLITPAAKKPITGLSGTLSGTYFTLYDNSGGYYYGSLSGMTVFLYGPSGVSITGTYSNTSSIAINSGSSTCSTVIYSTAVLLPCSDGTTLSGSLIGSQLILNDSLGGYYNGSIIGNQVFLSGGSRYSDGKYIPPKYFTGSNSTSGTLQLSGGGRAYTGNVVGGNVSLTIN